MAAKVIGNRGAYFHGTGGANRAQVSDLSLNWVTVLGSEDGDVGFVTAAGFNGHDTKLSYFLQGTAGTKIEFTLMDEGTATDPNPAIQSKVTWGNAITLADTNIVALVDANKIPIGFTAAKVTFAGPGTLYICGR